MENINEILSTSILRLRKEMSITQEELAGRLGISFQAVSKWENAKSTPDLAFLPAIADIFGVSIDELFSRTPANYDKSQNCAGLPWGDDEVIRAVLYKGRNIIDSCDIEGDSFTFIFEGEAQSVSSLYNVTVNGNVSGTVSTCGDVNCGSINGGCNVGGDIQSCGDINGDCNVGGDIHYCGNIKGDCTVGGNIFSR